MRTLFDPAAAWNRLTRREQEQFGIAALTQGVADTCFAEGTSDFGFDTASAEASRVIAALAEGHVLRRGQLPDGIDLAPLGIRQCHQCGCTDDFACDGGCEWVADNLCSCCKDNIAGASRDDAADLAAPHPPADGGRGRDVRCADVPVCTQPVVVSRARHLAWAKERALGALARGDAQAAVTSLVVDLLQHEEWQRDRGMGSRAANGMQSIAFGDDAVRQWIEAWR